MNKMTSKPILMLIIAVILIQASLLKNIFEFFPNTNIKFYLSSLGMGYILGAPYYLNYGIIAIYIFFYVFIFLCIFEVFSSLISKGNIYNIIRYKSKSRFLIQIIIRLILFIIIVVVVQQLVNFLIYGDINKFFLFFESSEFIKYIYIYLITFLDILLIYGIISIWKNKEYALFVMLFYITFSIIASTIIINFYRDFTILNYFLIPNHLMLGRSSIFYDNGYSLNVVLIQNSSLFCILIGLLILFLNKKDVL